MMRKVVGSLFLAGILLFGYAQIATGSDAENTIVLETSQGKVEILLATDSAPGHAERLKTLAKEGFYDGVPFHRVITGFMAQSGDPTGTGSGGSSYPDLKAEFSNISFDRGTVGMARSQSPDSANSQFFIMFAPAPHLNGSYTVVGKVTTGMDVVDSIKKGEKSRNGTVSDPDIIKRAYIAADG